MGTCCIAVWIVGLFYSKFLQSVGTYCFGLLFLYGVKNINTNFQLLSKKQKFLLLSLPVLFFAYLITLFWSADKQQFLQVIKNKIPFVLVPLSLISLQLLKPGQLQFLMNWFLLALLGACIWTFYQISLQDFDILMRLSVGQSVPTLVHHIAFSVLLVFGILFCLRLYEMTENKTAKGIYLAAGIFFFLVNHLMIARSGLVLTYLSLVIYFIYKKIEQKQYVKLALSIFLLVVIALINVYKNPYLKNKVDYTMTGKKAFENQDDSLNQYSDTRRIISLQLGYKIFQQHKIVGVGIGDVKQEMQQLYQQKYPKFEEEVQAKIHSQYLFILAACGSILGILCFISFVYMAYYFLNENKIVWFILMLNILLVCLWEAFLENQLGTSMFLIVFILGYLGNNKQIKSV